jgi:hypothetical protein
MTHDPSRTATLITQLRALINLTRTEAQVARLRVAQARTDDVRRELTENAANADRRTERIAGALRDLGALPDPVTPVLGQVAALVRGAVEQTQPLDEALLGDLTLEHQLLDRARYAAVLARSADQPAVAELADDLVTAHTATVDWLTDVLADVGGAGAPALQASPLQRVAAQVTRAVNTPARVLADSASAVADAGAAVADAGATVADAAGGESDGADRAADDASDPAGPTAGTADTASAADDGNSAPAADRLPIPGFADLDTHAAIAALRTLDDPDDVAAVLAFEQAHGNRPGVVSAVRAREAAVRV